jgi:hypothetical protein
VHVSLEMDEIQLGRRYYQSLFSATKRDAVVKVPILRKDRGEVTAIEHEDVEAEFTFRSKILHDEIMNHSEPLGRRFENLRIKRFPTRGLTVRQLDGYLDMLEQVDGFIPDLLILDYIGIMKTDARDLRISLSTTFEDLRGLLVRRNLAGFIPQQTTRASVNARIVKPTDIAEAFALVHTADQAITMSQTEFEKKLGVARLFVGHARDEMDEFGCIITQHYGLGQFCLDSAPLHSSFFELIDDMKKDGAGDDDEDGYDNRNDNND